MNIFQDVYLFLYYFIYVNIPRGHPCTTWTVGRGHGKIPHFSTAGGKGQARIHVDTRSPKSAKIIVSADQSLMEEVFAKLSSCAQLYVALVVASGRSAARGTGFLWVPPFLFTSHYKYLTIRCAWLCVIMDKKYVIQYAVRGCIPPKSLRRKVCPLIGFRREEMLDNEG